MISCAGQILKSPSYLLFLFSADASTLVGSREKTKNLKILSVLGLLSSFNYFFNIFASSAPVTLFCTYPHPPDTPVDITFGGGAPVSLSLYFCLAPPYIYTLSTLFSSAPPLFITRIFLLIPGLSQGGMGAEQFDPCISS